MADTDIKIKLTADPKPVRDAIKLIDRDLKELGGPILGDDSQAPPTPPPDNQGNTDGQTSPTTNSDRVNQSRRDRTNRLILRELTALRRELQKSNQNRTSPPPTGTPPGPTPPPAGGPNPPPPSGDGGGGGGGSPDSGSPVGDNSKIVDAIGKLSSLWSLAGIANAWGQKSLNREELAYKTYGSLLTYDDYNIAGRDASRAGVVYGYGYEDVMHAQKANMRYAGFRNLKALGADTEAILSTSAAYGLDTNQVANASGRMTGFGTFKIGEQQKFANMLAQAIQEHGMQGREDQELQVLQNISENLASRSTTVTEDMLRSGTNLYGALASVNPNLRGERGGNLAERMMDLANSDDKALDVAAGLGTKYTGISGYLELKRLKETDPQAYFQQVYSGLQEQFKGVDPERIDEMFRYKLVRGSGFSVSQADDMLKAIKSGGTFDLDRDTSAGEEARDKRLANWEQDQTLSEGTKYKYNKQAAEEEIGNVVNAAKSPFWGAFNEMSQGGQIAATAAMTAIPAIGGGLLMSKLGGLATSGLSGILGGAGGAGGAGGGLSSLFGGINAANAGKLVTGAKIGGSIITGGIAAYNTYDNLQKGDYRGASESAAGGIGAIGGGIAGAKIGAGIGTLFGGPIGTVIGGLIGGGIGALAGNFLGEKGGGLAYDILGGGDEDEHRPEETDQGKPSNKERREPDERPRSQIERELQENPHLNPDEPYNKGVQELRRLKETDPQAYRQQVYSNMPYNKGVQRLEQPTGVQGVQELRRLKETDPQAYRQQVYSNMHTQFEGAADPAHVDEMMKTIQSPHDRFDTPGMRDFTPRDQARIIQQTGEPPTAVLGVSAPVPGKSQNGMLLAHNPALTESRGGMLMPLQKEGSADEESDNRGTLERQFRLMEQDTRSTVDNTKAIQDNTKALEKNNKGSFLERLLGRNTGGKGTTPTSTVTPVVTPTSPVTPVSPSQAGGINYGNYEGEGGAGEGKYWRRQNDKVSFEGAQEGLMDALDMLAKFYHDQTGNTLIVTAGTNGDHPSNGTPYGHDAGYKIDINDWGQGGGAGALTGENGTKGWFTDELIKYGRSLGLGMNWEGDHLDVSLVGDQWDGNGGNAGGFKRTAPTGDSQRQTPKSHAHGNEYVPYDNYPALLHKGERVLTRMEANQLRDLPGMYLPPVLQIDEDNDSIPTRKQKRAAQEQYQYDTSHTFTNLAVIPGLRQMAAGGEPSKGQTKPIFPGVDWDEILENTPDMSPQKLQQIFEKIHSENSEYFDPEMITRELEEMNGNYNFMTVDEGRLSTILGLVHSGLVDIDEPEIQSTLQTIAGSNDVLQKFLQEKSEAWDSNEETIAVQRAKYKTMTLHQLLADHGYDPRVLYMNPLVYKAQMNARSNMTRTKYGIPTPEGTSKVIDPTINKKSGYHVPQMAIGGSVDDSGHVSLGRTPSTWLKPGDPGYEAQQTAMRRQRDRTLEYAKIARERGTNYVPGVAPQHTPTPLHHTQFNWTAPPFVLQPQTDKLSEPQYSFEDWKQPATPTGLELMLSLRSQTDELRNLLYGKDSGYNRITGDETADVARLKHLAQLRNTSTIESMIRYYAANDVMPSTHPPIPTDVNKSGDETGDVAPESPPQDKPKSQPFQWISNLLGILGKNQRFSGIASGLGEIINGKGNLSSWLSLGTGILGLKHGKKQSNNLAALNQSLGPLFQILGGKTPSRRTPRHAGPISDLRKKLFNKDGSINLDSGLWTSKGWPQPVKGTQRTSSVKPIPKTDTKPAQQPTDVSPEPSPTPKSTPKIESEKTPDIPKETTPTSPYDELGNRTDIDIPEYNRITKDDSIHVARSKREAQLDSMFTPPSAPEKTSDVPKDENAPVIPKDQSEGETSKPEKKKINWLQQGIQYAGVAARVASRLGLMGGKHNKTLSRVGRFLGGLTAGSHALDKFQSQLFNKDGSINLDSGLWTSKGWPQAPKSETPPPEKTSDVPKDENAPPTIPKSASSLSGEPVTKENPTQGLNQTTPPAQATTGTSPVDTSSTGMNADSISIELTVHVDGKIDGMTEANQGMVVAAMVSQFKQPDWLRGISNGFMRRANR